MPTQRKTKVVVRKRAAPPPSEKLCSDCQRLRPLGEFHKKPGGKYGVGSRCRECSTKYKAGRKQENRQYQKEYRKRRPKPVRVITVPEGCKQCVRCRSVLPVNSFGQDRRTKDGLRDYCRSCNSKAAKATQSLKYRHNHEYNLTQRFQSRVRATLPGYSLPELFGVVLPYSVEELIDHLKTTVPVGYAWENVFDGELQIDHCKPICAFRYTSPDERSFAECWALENLQLLPKAIHERKGANYNGKCYRQTIV